MSVALYQHLAGKPLAPREKRLCEMISRGMTNKQISAAMGVSQLSVAQYVSAALAKTKTKNRTALAAHWAEHEE
jgi:DNA-binding CsgD family transcriptional regulator